MFKTSLLAAAAALALATGAADAASLGLTTNPAFLSFEARAADLTDLEYFENSATSADLTAFDIAEAFGGTNTLDFLPSFDPGNPTGGAVAGGFDVFDGGGGDVIAGDVSAYGYTTGVIEVLFDNIVDSAGLGITGNVLAIVSFFDTPLNVASNPFSALASAGSPGYHQADISLYEVITPVPLPAGLPLALAGLGLLGLLARRKRV